MTDVLLRLPEVMRRVGLKKTAIYERINAGKFPKAGATYRRSWRHCYEFTLTAMRQAEQRAAALGRRAAP
ncbi:helix-turn-helix transcriptional regulator [Lysobacter changpingensis]|uniref:helix-turn-helix transcriptional regulator n=1 Tax=Lysobacter changpingensis TaxID=2792784 RepID=UPI001A8FD515|nr:AlpA family phage regulatory protein [Lysobacter changpingensis]